MIRQRCKEALVVIAAVATALPASPACGDHGMDIYTPWVGHGNNPGPTGFSTMPGGISHRGVCPTRRLVGTIWT